MASPRFLRSRVHVFHTRTSGDITLTTTWANLDTALDCTVPASVGDTIKATPSGLWNSQLTTGILHACTVVGGTPVNFLDGGGEPTTSTGSGFPAWQANILAGYFQPLVGDARYVIQAGDISGGLVTVRLRGYYSGGGSAKQIYADTAYPLTFAVENIGPEYGS